MKRFWMRSLTGQLIGLMLLAVLLSQVGFLVIYRSERTQALRDIRRDEFLARTSSVARLLEKAPDSFHTEILRAGSTLLTRYWILPEPPGDPLQWQRAARERLMRPRSAEAGRSRVNGVNPRLSNADLRLTEGLSWRNLPDDSHVAATGTQLLEIPGWNGYGVAVPVRDRLWLHAVYARPDSDFPSPVSFSVTLAATAAIVCALAVLAARRIGKPLRRLTDAAERIGRGEDIEPLPLEGAEDLRRTAEAFNRMQSRLRRFVEDRIRMIAAISHDLRTPITTLRLRVEFIREPEMRERLIATLDEMQAMTEATLAFARDEAVNEPTRKIDLDALIVSVCDDLRELGWDVTFAESGRLPWRCRPDALRRALRNLIENAVRYGQRARLSAILHSDRVEIMVDDDGPGIPEADRERVFAPFVRMESSRNRTTGGVGLGLSIARSIVRSHGGDILLRSVPAGGLRVIVSLPRS